MNRSIYFTVLACLLVLSASVDVWAGEEVEGEELKNPWTREISAGFNLSSGNTEENQLTGKLVANKKTKKYEFTLKGEGYYASTDKKMNAQKFAGMGRFAYSFGRDLKWYNFYSLDADRDRFADIDYRLVPAAGIGYWFFDEPDFKALAELGAGIEHTNYRSNVEDKTEMVLIPRGYLEKKLWGESRISEDIKFYPTVTGGGEFRIYSETAFTNPISEVLSLRISVIDEYNSDPPIDTKKNDIRLTSSVVCTF